MRVRSVQYFICTGLVAWMASSQAAAQTAATPGNAPAPPVPVLSGQPEAGGGGFAMGGVRWLNLTSINNRMRSEGYPEFGRNYFTVGGGGQVVYHRFVIGGEGNAVLPFDGSRNTASSRQRLSGGFGLFRFGYAVIDTGSFRVFPLVGFGYGGMTLNLSRKGDSTFGDVLANPAREASMTAGGLLLDAGLGADYRIAFSKARRHTGFFSFGVRGGYLFVPYTTDWSMSGGKVADGPALGLSGPYVQMMLGLGSASIAP
jgi:hypothetical protein